MHKKNELLNNSKYCTSGSYTQLDTTAEEVNVHCKEGKSVRMNQS